MSIEGYFRRPYYRVGEVALMAGMTTETVRFYEDKGLIACEKRTDKGYRLFTPDAVKKLQDIRFYRSLGVPINDIAQMINSADSRVLTDVLNRRERAIYQEMERSRLMLERIRDMREAKSREMGSYTLRWHPAYYKIINDAKAGDDSYDLRCGLPEEIVRDYFFAFYGGFFVPVSHAQGESRLGQCEHGFLIDPFLASNIGIPGEFLGSYVPSKYCVNTSVIIKGFVTADHFTQAFDWMERNNLVPTGTIIGKTIASYKEADEWIRSYDLWIPVQKDGKDD